MRFKYIDCSYHFLEIYYRRLNLNILKLAQLLIDGNIDSGSGPTQNDCKSPRERPKNVFKEALKKCDLSGKIYFILHSDPNIQNFP